MLIEILCGVLATTTIFLSMLVYYSLKRITQYEEIILQVNDKIDYVNKQLKLIDEKGTFEADDEVGFFFEELKLNSILNNLFTQEVDDATIKEEEKEEE
jgi:hypothetical protein